MTSRDLPPALQSIETAISDGSSDDLPALVGDLARLEALARLRLATPAPAQSPDTHRTDSRREKLIDVKAVAEILDVEPRWLYERADWLPFTRRLGPRTLRFSKPGLLRWLETRK